MRISLYGIFDQLGKVKYTQENDDKDIELYRFLHCADVQVRYYFWLLEFIEYLLHGQHFKNHFSHQGGHYYTHFTDDETKA